MKTWRLKQGRERKSCNKSSRGPGEKEIFRTALMREMNDERCNKKIRGERDRRRRKTGRERGKKGAGDWRRNGGLDQAEGGEERREMERLQGFK